MIDFTGIVDWLVGFLKVSWDLFCMAPLTCILFIVVVIAAIPVWRATMKKIDEAKGPIILR